MTKPPNDPSSARRSGATLAPALVPALVPGVPALLLLVALAFPPATAAQALGDELFDRDDIAWVGAKPPRAEDLARDPGAFEELLAENGLVLDPAARTVSARGGTLHDGESLAGMPVEYLVVTDRGRTHESLFVLRATPSLLDACLRALGLPRGSPLTVVPREPPPTPEELAAGVTPWEAVPPAGELLDIDVSWTGDDGRPHLAPLETLLEDVRTGAALPVLGWVYTGSGFGPMREGRKVAQAFLADALGNVVGISPLDRGGEGVCLVERNSAEGVDDSLYAPDPETAPPRGTPVTLVFRPRGERTPARPTVAGDTTVNGPTGQALHAWLARYAAWGFSGVVLAAHGDELLLHEAFGRADRSQGVPVSTETVFPLSSISKQFTATGILQLEAAGRLSLDGVIATGLRDVPEDKAGVRIRHLLQHASGLPQDAAPPSEFDLARAGGVRATDRDGVVAAILATPLLSEPGTRFSYSNAGYALLAAILERAADDTFRGYLREHVLQPAGLTSAGLFAEPRWRGPRLARGYAGPPGDLHAVPVPAYGPLTWTDIGAGAIVATVRDLWRFERALADGTLLPEAQAAAMFTPGFGDYGCAWWIVDGGEGRGRLAWHDGLLPGYRSEVRRYLDRDVTLIFAGNTERAGVLEPLADLVFAAEDRAEGGAESGADGGADSGADGGAPAAGGAPALPPVVLGEDDPAAAVAAAGLAGRWALAQDGADGQRHPLVLRAAQDGWLVTEGLDQEALEALFGIPRDAGIAARKALARTAALVTDVGAGRWEQVAVALGEGTTAEQARAQFEPWWQLVSSDQGAYRSIAGLARPDGARTRVQVDLEFERGTVRREVTWEGGALAGITIPRQPLDELRLRPASADEALAWDIDHGLRLRLVREGEGLRAEPAGGAAVTLRPAR